MTRREQERLVGRYLGGELTGAEEQDFFIQVAVDNDLRQALKAYQVVDSALHKHRESIPVQHPESRQRLIATLRQTATMNPPQGRAVRYKPGIAAIVGSWFNRRKALVSATTFLWMIAGFSAFALVTGTLVVVPMMTDTGDDPPPPAAVQRVAGPNRANNTPSLQNLDETSISTNPTVLESTTLRSDDNKITTTQPLPVPSSAMRNATGTNTLSQRRAIPSAASRPVETTSKAHADETTASEEASTAKRPEKDTINARAKVKVMRP